MRKADTTTMSDLLFLFRGVQYGVKNPLWVHESAKKGLGWGIVGNQ